MGYLLNQMEKLAKETKRSFGDKVALGAGAGAGAGLGASAVGAPLGYMLGDQLSRDGDDFAKRMGSYLADKNALQRAWFKTRAGTLVAYKLPSVIAKDVRDTYRSSPEKGLKRLKSAGQAALDNAISVHHYMPKKIKLLAALGIPVTAAAGYGGYKATDALLKA